MFPICTRKRLLLINNTANAIKVVLKKKEKVEYEREKLVGND